MNKTAKDNTNTIIKHFSTEREAADTCQISACALRSALKGNEVCREIHRRIAVCATAIENKLPVSKVVNWKRNDKAVRSSSVELGRRRRGLKPRDIRGVEMRFTEGKTRKHTGLDDGPLLPRIHNGYQLADMRDIMVKVGDIGDKQVYAPAKAVPLPNITPDQLVIL